MNKSQMMPHENELVDFLLNGRLGAFTPALSESQLYDLLGKPDDHFVRDRQSPKPNPDASPSMVIVFYGNFGVTYEDDRVIGAYIDYRTEQFRVPKELGVQWPESIKAISLAMFSGFLERRQIAYRRRDLSPGTAIVLDLSNRTEVGFASEEGNLAVVSFFPSYG